jgi:hypothetical protein
LLCEFLASSLLQVHPSLGSGVRKLPLPCPGGRGPLSTVTFTCLQTGIASYFLEQKLSGYTHQSPTLQSLDNQGQEQETDRHLFDKIFLSERNDLECMSESTGKEFRRFCGPINTHFRQNITV